MRQFIILGSVLFLFMSARGQAEPPSTLDSETYTINQFGILRSQPVSFSVGYPKGWTKLDFGARQAHESLVTDSPIVCRFSSSPLRRPEITIFRASLATAKDEAAGFALGLHQQSGVDSVSFSPIKTKAGDSGYLVASETDLKDGKLMSSDFFFHVGPKGAIRISVSTRPEDFALRENLRNLILETLHF